MAETCHLPPHIVAQLSELRASGRFAPEIVDAIEQKLKVDMTLPHDERYRRWQAALGELNRVLQMLDRSGPEPDGSER